MPAALGHEVVAEVVEAPPGSEWGAGDRVVVLPLLPCAVRGLPPCRYCAAGAYNPLRELPGGRIGSRGGCRDSPGAWGAAWPQMMAAHPSRLVRVPDNVPDEVAVLTDSVASALQPVLDNFPDDRHTVVIYGAGTHRPAPGPPAPGPGLRGPGDDGGPVPLPGRTGRSRGSRCRAVQPRPDPPGRGRGGPPVPTTLGGGNLEGGADLFFDCVGSTSSLQEGLLTLRGRGTYVLVGTAGVLGPVDFSSLWFRELKLTGSSMYAHGVFQGQTVRTYEKAVELLARGDYPSQGLVSHLFPLADYRRAFQAAFNKRRHHSLKVALDLRD